MKFLLMLALAAVAGEHLHGGHGHFRSDGVPVRIDAPFAVFRVDLNTWKVYICTELNHSHFPLSMSVEEISPNIKHSLSVRPSSKAGRQRVPLLMAP